MLARDDLQRYLRQQLPPDLQPYLPDVAEAIERRLSGDPELTREWLRRQPWFPQVEALRAPDGVLAGSLMSFGHDSSIGDVTIGDILIGSPVSYTDNSRANTVEQRQSVQPRGCLNITIAGMFGGGGAAAAPRAARLPLAPALLLGLALVAAAALLVAPRLRDAARLSAPPLSAEVNVLVADFGDRGGLAEALAEDLDGELRDSLGLRDLAIETIPLVRSEDEAKAVAERRVARDGRARVVVVLWGQADGERLARFRMTVLDQVEGNEVTAELERQPHADLIGSELRKDLRERLAVVVLFVQSLQQLAWGNLSAAQPPLEKALRLTEAAGPGAAGAAGVADTLHFYRGRVLHGLRQGDAAAAEFQLIVDSLNPDYPMAYIGLGNIALDAQDADRAEQYYSAALAALDRGINLAARSTYARGKAYLNLARTALHRAGGDPARAEAYGREAEQWSREALAAFEEEPGVPYRYLGLADYYLALSLERQGSPTYARSALQRCAERLSGAALLTDPPSVAVLDLCRARIEEIQAP